MKKFGFELTELGWYNAAEKTKLNEVKEFQLNTKIANGGEYERVYAYVVNPKIKSIFSLLANDKTNFNIVFADDPDLLLWESQRLNLIGVGYKTEGIGYKIIDLAQQPVTNANISLENRELSQFKKDLKQFTKNYRDENKILVDLEYQAFFEKEKIREKSELMEQQFIDKLVKIVYPCCFADTHLPEFSYRELGEVFKILSNCFQEPINVDDESINRLRITVNFMNLDLHEIATVINETCELKFKHDQYGYVFSYREKK